MVNKKRVSKIILFLLFAFCDFYIIFNLTGLSSLRETTFLNIIGDILFFIGLIGFFLYAFDLKFASPKVWKIIFWTYITYILITILFTSQDAIMIGNNGIAYDELAEEGLEIFLIEVAIVSLVTLILLFPIYKLGYKKYPRRNN